MTEVSNHNERWDVIITSADGSGLNINIKEIWTYRDLLLMFVKKDIITVYKQTILGPIWFLIQPILTTLTYVVIFTNVANIGTDDVPPVLFYLGSVALWNYFSDTLNVTSKTFTENANIFGKVYFPRLIVPLSKIISGLIKFLIQFALFLVLMVFYMATTNRIHPNVYVLLFPILMLLMAMLGLGIGLLITAMTTKYRDLAFLVSFGVQLLMYATPVIYPISKFKSHQMLLWLNPLTSIFETFKFSFLGKGVFSPAWLMYTTVFSVLVLIAGTATFNNMERRFIDTV